MASLPDKSKLQALSVATADAPAGLLATVSSAGGAVLLGALLAGAAVLAAGVSCAGALGSPPQALNPKAKVVKMASASGC